MRSEPAPIAIGIEFDELKERLMSDCNFAESIDN